MITRKSFITTAISIVIVAMAAVTLLDTSLAASLTPADHLVPPPLPVAQRLKHARAPAPSVAANQPERQQPIPIHSGSGENSVPPGFMTRIARWFGFGPSGEQQLTSGSYKHAKYSKNDASGKQAYAYPQPNQQPLSQASGANVKESCINCNKYPWVPMLPPGIQYPLRQQYQQQQWAQPHQQQQQSLEAQASQHHPQKQQPNSIASNPHLQQQTLVKQRAVQFHFPFSNHLPPQKGSSPYSPQEQLAPQLAKLPLTPPQYPALPFVPIPLPNLSASALPPLYSAQPFRPSLTPTSTAHTEQQLPTTEPTHFTESIGAHSELQPDSVYPTQIPPTTDQEPSFEIVKSHQLTDFVSSVEYPTTFVESQAFDVPSETMPKNHKAGTEQPNTVQYQHETLDPKLSGSHVPASHLLTEIGNFGSASYQQPEYSTLQMTHLDETTSFYPTQSQSKQFESHSQVLAVSSPNELFYDLADNFPSASSKNFSAVQNANQEELLPKWTAETYSSIQTDEFYYSTPQPQSPQTTTEISTEKSLQGSGSEFITERLQDTTVDFVPSLQTEFNERPHTFSQKPQRERETPKRLLDAPIAHTKGSQRSPGSLTRDPSELNFRLGSNFQPHEFQHANHVYAGDLQQLNTKPWLVTPTPAHTVSSASPTPTSTYGALDASGQYAGMAPPPAPPATLPRIIVPYNTKNKPRPFEPARSAGSAIPNLLHDNWSQANDVVEHVQQESQVVSRATKAPTNGPRTTKYLTRILASNLRDLLKREHEQKNEMKPTEGFDFSKLQRTIDDWTEQEFTSLSHRPSTPTIAGRSKNIPPEYLTTTPATPRQAKTTNLFNISELSSSINNLEPLLVDRGSKRFEYPSIDDNSIHDYFYESTLARKRSTTTSTTTTPRPEYTTHTTTTTTPFYIRAIPTSVPTELWQKARVSISPQTKERIYVVTPQPLFFPQRAVPISTEEPPESGVAAVDDKAFKSPRFLVRPTPRKGPSTPTSTSASLYTPEIFGLRGLSAFIPSKPVEIIDGNSKVLTIATPSDKVTPPATHPAHPDAETHVQRRRSTSKPTMAPSPR